jgi:small-conductance mechanosensitive channel
MSEIFLGLALDSLLLGGMVMIFSFIALIAVWSLVVKALFSVFGKSKFYFIPNTLKELFLSVSFVFLLLSLYFSLMVIDESVTQHEFFKVWQILLIFTIANIFLRVILTGLDSYYRKSKDRSGIFRSIGLLKGTIGLVLYFIAIVISINVLSSEVGTVVTAILLFIVVLVFLSGYEQIKSIMAGLQLGDYYVEPGKLITIAGYTGFVESVHGRSTVIRTIDGDVAVIPNSLFFKDPFVMSSNDGADITLSVIIKGKSPQKNKEKLSSIMSRLSVELKELPSEVKPKVFLFDVGEDILQFSVSLSMVPDSDLRVVLDRITTELHSEFKSSLLSAHLK